MAENKINLQKNVISNQTANSKLDSSFNEVITSAERIDDEKLKKIYEDLFYKIPQRGKLSHETIVIKSDAEVNPQTNINLQGQITLLEQDLKEEIDRLNNLETPENEHPIFSNNTFVQEGDPGQSVILGTDIWYIQKGFKRKITSSDEDFYFNLLRKLNRDMLYQSNNQKIPLENSPLFQLAKTNEINSILEAQDIHYGEDISVTPIAKVNQTYLTDQFTVEFECFGVENYYKFDDDEIEALEEYAYFMYNRMGKPDGFWYKDLAGQCEVTYVNDIDPSIGFTPEDTTLTLGVPGYISRSISRDASIYSGDPFSAAYYETPKREIWETRPPDTFNTTYPPMPMIKEWGSQGKFPSIKSIKKGSRIKVKIMNKRDDGSPIYPREGQPNVEEWTQLSGINANHYEVKYGLDIFGMFDRESKYGNQMINNMCYGPTTNQCYGRLNQNWRRTDLDLNKRLMRLLSNPDSRYYKEDRREGTIRGKVYGQPILHVDNKLMIYLGGYSSWGSDWNFFYNLENGGINKVKNKHLSDEVEGYDRKSIYSTSNNPHKQYFQWINPNRKEDNSIDGKLNNPFLIYPGLDLGHGLNGSNIFDGDNNQNYTDLGNNYFKSKTIVGTPFETNLGIQIPNYNIFNPGNNTTSGRVGIGSNFGITQWMVDNLDFMNPFYTSTPIGEEMFIINLDT